MANAAPKGSAVPTVKVQPLSTFGQDISAVAITSIFGGLLGLFIAVVKNGIDRVNTGVVESIARSAFIGFLSGLLISCAGIALWSLYLHGRRHYVSAVVEQSSLNARAIRPLTNNAKTIQQNLQGAGTAYNQQSSLWGGLGIPAQTITPAK
jgi:hypothetical protein